MSFKPAWYDSNLCGKLRYPNLLRAVQDGTEYARQNNIKPYVKNKEPNVVLSVIDMQNDFCSPEGALYVSGAEKDVDKLCSFMYNNVGAISNIVASLDTHYLFQPFHMKNWAAGANPSNRNSNGKRYTEGDNPEPFTLITYADVQNDVWRPTVRIQFMHSMLKKLESTYKKNLTIWPLHCILGSAGHAFDANFLEAIYFQAGCRNVQYNATTKGLSPLSEHYGILKAEVEFPEDSHTQLNVQMLNNWKEADRIYFAGEAKSHCVLETLRQIAEVLTNEGQQSLLNKMYIIKDCMSSVPDIHLPNGGVIEFDKMANEKFAEFEQLGFKFVDSTHKIVL